MELVLGVSCCLIIVIGSLRLLARLEGAILMILETLEVLEVLVIVAADILVAWTLAIRTLPESMIWGPTAIASTLTITTGAG